jgi:hypothetical protein
MERECMAGTDDADPNRLAGRRHKPPRRDEEPPHQAEAEDDTTADDEIDTVTKLMGFLRRDGDADEPRPGG